MDALLGLFDVLNMALDSDNIYLHCGMDNLKALRKNLIDLLVKGYDNLEFQDSLCRIEFNERKFLFHNNSKEKKKEEKQDEENIS